jgi:transcriptional regulator with XRE-family HTH domain
MAQIKVRPRPGALSTLLKEKGLTQMEAHTKTYVDRKTLLKIERGEAVKLETLQQVATRLQVADDYFLNPPPTAKGPDDDDVVSALEPGNVMLRKLDVERLEHLLKGEPLRIRWQLNAQVRDGAVRTFLEEMEDAVENFRQQIFLRGIEASDGGEPTDSLRFQLSQLKIAEDMATRLAWLAEHRLAVLGTDYLSWERRLQRDVLGPPDQCQAAVLSYDSIRIVVLSIEPLGTQSRRVQVSLGSVPPVSVAPGGPRVIYVGGRRLVADEGGTYSPWLEPF